MEKINQLTFIKYVDAKPNDKKIKALFTCDCGKELIIICNLVKWGQTKCCIECSNNKISKSKITHGKTNHKLYRKWQDMLNRCRNKKVDRYPNYGGRGIIVCKEWENSFESYFNWCISNGWEGELQVDRIDNNGNYEPSNCRIVTSHQQHFNKQNTFYVLVDDKKYCLAEILNNNNMQNKYHTIWKGIKKRNKTMQYYINKYGISITTK